ncbi:MAG: sensor domain-containing diguanylate cyclase [Myxococcales bacterium]|nr:MAG: sensor domain-containing diguanylate cyclase [Myxococcales bacterium]
MDSKAKQQAGKGLPGEGDEKEDQGVRIDSESLPVTVDLGIGEGTPRSARESPILNWRRVYDAIPESTLVLDLDGVIRSANRQFLLQTGFAEKDVLGRPLMDFITLLDPQATPSELRRAVDRFIVNAIQAAEPLAEIEGSRRLMVVSEIQFRNKAGDVLPVEFKGAPIYNEDGNIVGLACLGRDMSEFHKLRAQLESCQAVMEEYNRSLENQMGDRLKEVRQRARMLEELSVTDELTKLYNRRFLFKRVSEELERANRYGTFFSIVILDIDFFKKINDTYGHLAGDMVLYELSGILRGSIRQVDVVARTGGEEFVILLPSVREGHAFLFCERLREKVKAFQFTYLPEGVKVSVSMGIADYPREGVHDIDELIQLSDRALYKAKETRDATVSSLNLAPGSPREK